VGIFSHHDNISPAEALRRGEAVRALAASEPFRWLVEAAVTDAHLDWENAKTVEAREQAHQHLMGVRSLDKQIQKVIDRGAAATRALKPVKL
jgi:hypothetical protein